MGRDKVYAVSCAHVCEPGLAVYLTTTSSLRMYIRGVDGKQFCNMTIATTDICGRESKQNTYGCEFVFGCEVAKRMPSEHLTQMPC